MSDVLARIAVFAPATLPGQSATLLSNGAWLLLGGVEAGRVSDAARLYDSVTGELVTLPARLSVARAYHSATVLPDGTVLVLGGENAAGTPLRAAERFDPAADVFIPVPNIAVLERSRHAVNLMPDGRLLITGGKSPAGLSMAEIEIVDGTTFVVAAAVQRMSTARVAHLARLLPGGHVLLAGGLPSGSTAPAAELFDPATSQVVRYADAPAGALPDVSYLNIAPGVRTFLPDPGAGSIALDTRFAVRFNKPMRPDSLTFENVSLTGLGARVPFRLTVAEGGLLLFATPTQALYPASRYALWVQGGSDESGRAITQVSAGYLTTGAAATVGGTGGATATTGSVSSTGTTGGAGATSVSGMSPVAASAGAWIEVADSWMRSVAPPPTMRSLIYGSPAGVINAWSGGDYDPVRRQLVLWGGGHGDYAGNELYAFSIDTLKWTRLTDPSAVTPADVRLSTGINPANAYYPDGKPRARHTYGYVAYVPSIDRYCSIGGEAFFISGQTGTDNIDCFDFTTKTWAKRGVTGSRGHAQSAYDPLTKTVWTMGNLAASYLSQWDPATGVSTVRSAFDYQLQYTLASMSAVIDTKRRKFVLVGAGQVYAFNIAATGLLTKTAMVTTGATAVLAAKAPGLVYDPVADRVVAWVGGSDLYSLNMDTGVWTRLTAAAGSVDPGAPAAAGTYGRFRYVPSKDMYIVVSSIDDNVFFYKPVRAASATTSSGTVVTSPDDPGTGAPPPVAAAAPVPGAGFTIPVTISDRAFSTARTNVPVTFGHVFRKGDIPAAYTVTARTKAGAALETQVDIKARHADGSMRHAIISVLLPSQAAAATEIVLAARTAVAAGTPIAPTLAIARTANLGTVTLNIGGVAYTARVNPTLVQSADRWLSGPLVTEWRVPVVPADAAGNPHPHLLVMFDVRAYRGMAYVRTDFTIEHPWAYEAGTRSYTYDATLTLGGKTVYTKTALTHYPQARWRKVFWLDGNDNRLNAKYEINYLLATGAVPNYDRSVVPLRAAMISELNFTTPRSEPMMAGYIDDYMPGVGNHHDLGILPPAAVMYLLSMDDLARLNMTRSGDLFGSWSVHYRDRAAGRLLSIEQYPYASASTNRTDTFNPVTKRYEQVEFANCLTQAATPCKPVLAHENGAHQPSQAYVPYLVSGDRYYLEELQFWANYNMIDMTPGYRDFAKGTYKRNQVRGQAWNMRTVGQAAYITPDADQHKAYFLANLNNNIAYYDQTAFATYPLFSGTGALDGPTTAVYNAGLGLAPWQDDMFTQAIGHVAVDLGFPQARSLAIKKAKFPVGRMIDPGYCWILGSNYTLNIKSSATANSVSTLSDAYRLTFDSWATSDGRRLLGMPCGSQEMADFINAYTLATSGTNLRLLAGEMVGYSDSFNGYPMHMQPGLAYAVDLGAPGAATAWAQFEARTRKPAVSGSGYGALSSSPHYAIRPRSF